MCITKIAFLRGVAIQIFFDKAKARAYCMREDFPGYMKRSALNPGVN